MRTWMLVLAVVAVLGLNPTATAQDFFSVKPLDLLARCDNPESEPNAYHPPQAFTLAPEHPLVLLAAMILPRSDRTGARSIKSRTGVARTLTTTTFATPPHDGAAFATPPQPTGDGAGATAEPPQQP